MKWREGEEFVDYCIRVCDTGSKAEVAKALRQVEQQIDRSRPWIPMDYHGATDTLRSKLRLLEDNE